MKMLIEKMFTEVIVKQWFSILHLLFILKQYFSVCNDDFWSIRQVGLFFSHFRLVQTNLPRVCVY